MSKSMQHWNNHQMVVVDLETSGLDPYYHEILQICILPLDSNIQPRKDVTPFYIELRPDFPQRIEKEAIRVNKLDINRICQRGFDQEKAKDLLDEWVNKLGLAYTAYGNRKRLIPLGQGIMFDIPFLKRWLGVTHFHEIFDSRVRDTEIAAVFLNDIAGMHAEVVPYSKVNLTWLCKQLKVPLDRAHDALQDCLATAEVYRRMLQRGLLG